MLCRPSPAGAGIKGQDLARKQRVTHSEAGQIIARIETAYPKASLMYARMVMALLDADDHEMSVSDLSDAVGKGRDSTAVQNAVGRLVAMGMVERELMPAGEESGRFYVARLTTRSVPDRRQTEVD